MRILFVGILGLTFTYFLIIVRVLIIDALIYFFTRIAGV